MNDIRDIGADLQCGPTRAGRHTGTCSLMSVRLNPNRRYLDIRFHVERLIALAALVVLLPALLIIGVVVRLASTGSALYRKACEGAAVPHSQSTSFELWRLTLKTR